MLGENKQGLDPNLAQGLLVFEKQWYWGETQIKRKAGHTITSNTAFKEQGK